MIARRMTRFVARLRPAQFFTTGLVLFGATAVYFIGYSDAFATVYQKGMVIVTTTADAIMAPTWPATLDNIAYDKKMLALARYVPPVSATTTATSTPVAKPVSTASTSV